MGRVTTRRPVTRLRGAHSSVRPDTPAVEEPLEIRVGGKPLAITMRTPGHDLELAHGFLATEGVVARRNDVTAARYCDGVDDAGHNTYNVLDVTLAPGVTPPDPSIERNFYTTSSCGMCGRASLEAIRLLTTHSPANDHTIVDARVISELPIKLRQYQKVFATTGGLHGAALFDTDGTMLVTREDVGRHNAVDKVIGWSLLHDQIPLRGRILMVSGRASFELAQKAVMAGLPILAAVSAPSSLAVDLAADSGLTLAGFVRGSDMNIYAHGHRISGLD
ncbi:sulfurtransferase FdhD [Gordonia terrae]|uniref:Sulfur carrier protein FdhD n=1 Tax=Gordonia terrae TaxID=2055 RepID=A0A2I1RBY5_9ACTN|nr:formate dehydrogenase accessory sulfurtransferase FdhD [Gordonia terrae]PKZ66640.1 sulfurtransferase FdhD [Gordonia terrae]